MAYELSEDRKKYLAALEIINEQKKAFRKKHASKLYRGFFKMHTRQMKKPDDVCIKLPMCITLPKNFKGEYTHCINVTNNKWNGMNLNQLCSQKFDRCSSMYDPFTVNALTGKYSLSINGKRKLQNLKTKHNAKNNIKDKGTKQHF